MDKFIASILSMHSVCFFGHTSFMTWHKLALLKLHLLLLVNIY